MHRATALGRIMRLRYYFSHPPKCGPSAGSQFLSIDAEKEKASLDANVLIGISAGLYPVNGSWTFGAV